MSPADARIVVLISGGGTNLQAILDATRDHEIPGIVAAVISNRPDAQGLGRAAKMGIPTEVLDHRGFETRADFDLALMRLIDRYEPDLIVLAGFMRILGSELVGHYAGRMLNIHPSLLPAYRGLHTHARALADGAREHGASVHFVTADLDGGPVIIQALVPVLNGDTPETLAARVLEQEHIVYPLAVRWFCEGRLKLRDTTIELDGRALDRPVRLDELEPAVGAP
jgi:phosphoribosylglycinamide formyltransferase-1